jgi:hypothetical protein
VFTCILASSRITQSGSWKTDPSFPRGFCHTQHGRLRARPLSQGTPNTRFSFVMQGISYRCLGAWLCSQRNVNARGHIIGFGPILEQVTTKIRAWWRFLGVASPPPPTREGWEDTPRSGLKDKSSKASLVSLEDRVTTSGSAEAKPNNTVMKPMQARLDTKLAWVK